MEGDKYITTSELLVIMLLAAGPVALAVAVVLWLNLRRRREAAPRVAAIGTALGTLMVLILTLVFWQLDLGWLAIPVEPIFAAPIAAGASVIALFLLWPRRLSSGSLDDQVTRSKGTTEQR